MMLKVLVLAVAVSVTYAAQCGIPAITPISSQRLDSVIAHLTGKSDGRIVGGVEAKPHSFPWQVALTIRVGARSYSCGGSIIDNKYILTAAHCITIGGPVNEASGIKVRVGAHNRHDTSESGAKTYDVVRVIPHPQYDADETQNDFGLLELAQPLLYTDKVSPICLADASEGGALGQECTVTGWGATAVGGAGESKLRQVQVKIDDHEQCKKSYRPLGITVTSEMLCASAPGKDSCQGDSGGPFACKRANGQYALIGVVSFGYGCAFPGFPGIYAQTSTALNWIASVVDN